MKESDQALKDGDWKKYGEAQERLRKALDEAGKLQDQQAGGGQGEGQGNQGGGQGGQGDQGGQGEG